MTSVLYHLSLSPSDQIITARLGDDVTLTCDVPTNVSSDAVQWNKDDLEDPSVREHVERHLSNNTLSLMINSVNPNDTGFYKCCINSSCTEPIKTVYLDVSGESWCSYFLVVDVMIEPQTLL